MNYAPLSHIVEPERLLLTWQPVDEQSPHRTRRTVGEVLRADSDSDMVFRYLRDIPDFAAAQASGFQGFPAFPIDGNEVSKGVHETFMRRLPPRKREDFAEFLAQHRLPSPFPYSDTALLGYTGARLPSDGFALVPQFPTDVMPCDYLMEVAGLRHVYSGSMTDIHNGDVVSFQMEPLNPVDPDAIAVLHAGRAIGYVTRTMRSTFHAWLGSKKLLATVERQNGKPERPLIYLRISVT
jgi:hypothetical protein